MKATYILGMSKLFNAPPLPILPVPHTTDATEELYTRAQLEAYGLAILRHPVWLKDNEVINTSIERLKAINGLHSDPEIAEVIAYLTEERDTLFGQP